ncbi:MAG TPA: DNA cytosine methyltransferase [Abditibacteriaceae bacterium]|jgi:DNA (cytosine-5)-methyltransferase 1
MMKTSARPTTVSLFCGCGGFDYGFSQEGFQTIAAYDIDPSAIRVHRNNLGSSAEVCDLSLGKLPSSLPRSVDVMLAGPPCQGFSTAGKRELNDPRNSLLIACGLLAVRIQPKVAVIENVAGVTAGKHVQYWNVLQTILRDSGYQTTDLLCTGTEMGVAQTRKRRVMVAWKGKIAPHFEIPKITGGVLQDALANVSALLPDHDAKMLEPGSESGQIASRIQAGQKLSNVRGGSRAVPTWSIPEVFGCTTAAERTVLKSIQALRRRYRTRPTGDADPVDVSILIKEHGTSVTSILNSLHKKGYVKKLGECYDLVNSFNGKFRRLEWDQPSFTVDTRFGQPRYFLHPTENRGFTVREAARIQGFADTFTFGMSDTNAYRLIGNAVPPPMARCLARMIRNTLL